MRQRFQFRNARTQLAALRIELGAIDQHAGALHLEQHLCRRQLDLLVNEAQLFVGFDAWPQHFMQRAGDLRIFARVVSRPVNCDLVEAQLIHTFAAHFDIGQCLAAQMPLRQRIDIVIAVRFEHVRLELRVVRDAGKPDAAICERVHLVFHVVPELALMRAFKPRPQLFEHIFDRQLFRRTCIAMCQRYVARLQCFD